MGQMGVEGTNNFIAIGYDPIYSMDRNIYRMGWDYNYLDASKGGMNVNWETVGYGAIDLGVGTVQIFGGVALFPEAPPVGAFFIGNGIVDATYGVTQIIWGAMGNERVETKTAPIFDLVFPVPGFPWDSYNFIKDQFKDKD